MRPLLIAPLGLAFIGLVLSFLCIFAGNRPGFMDDYQIVSLNMSTLGHDVLPKIPDLNIPGLTDDDFITSMSGITDQINGIMNNIVDDVSRSLGIQQFYNWHLRNFCEGMYDPNYKAANAKFDVKNCSQPDASYHFKIGDIVDRQLRAGPLHIGLQNLKWPDAIQKKFDLLSVALHIALAFYSISITAIAISLITGIIILLGGNSILLSFITWGLLALSFVSLFVSSIIITVVNSMAIQIVTETGNKIGVFAYRGSKYLALTWCAMAVMMVAVLTYGLAIFLGKKSERSKMTEKQ